MLTSLDHSSGLYRLAVSLPLIWPRLRTSDTAPTLSPSLDETLTEGFAEALRTSVVSSMGLPCRKERASLVLLGQELHLGKLLFFEVFSVAS